VEDCKFQDGWFWGLDSLLWGSWGSRAGMKEWFKRYGILHYVNDTIRIVFLSEVPACLLPAGHLQATPSSQFTVNTE
jgi:hypothetical protein